MRATAMVLVLMSVAPESAQSSDGAYGPTTLKLEARCKGRGEQLSEAKITAGHRVSDVGQGVAEVFALFDAKGCVLSEASKQAVNLLAEMIVHDFYGSVYFATVASNHISRTSDLRQPAPVLDFAPCAHALAVTEHSGIRPRLEKTHDGLVSGLQGAKSVWTRLSGSERKLLNDYVFKVSAAYLRCAANQSEPSSLTYHEDAAKILDEAAGFHAAFLAMLEGRNRERAD